jgi:hypothetical protein
MLFKDLIRKWTIMVISYTLYILAHMQYFELDPPTSLINCPFVYYPGLQMSNCLVLTYFNLLHLSCISTLISLSAISVSVRSYLCLPYVWFATMSLIHDTCWLTQVQLIKLSSSGIWRPLSWLDLLDLRYIFLFEFPVKIIYPTGLPSLTLSNMATQNFL